jgi:hypothetical protein
MRIEILSNHPAEQLEIRQNLREERFQNETQAHQAACEEIERAHRASRERYENTLRTCRVLIGKSWEKKNAFGVLKGGGAYVFTSLFGRPRKAGEPLEPTKEEPDEQDAIWEAGMRGEDRVVDALAGLLDDSWICLRGFNCTRGEIDLILVGPGGIVAVEIKSIKGRITCSQECWTRDVFDNYGNCVQREVPIRDKSGRTPAQQIRESAAFLSERLGRRNNAVPIRTVVLFSNPKAVLRSVDTSTVDEVVLLEDWDPTGGDGGTRLLSDTEVEAIAAKIQTHHQKNPHNKRSTKN